MIKIFNKNSFFILIFLLFFFKTQAPIKIDTYLSKSRNENFKRIDFVFDRAFTDIDYENFCNNIFLITCYDMIKKLDFEINSKSKNSEPSLAFIFKKIMEAELQSTVNSIRKGLEDEFELYKIKEMSKIEQLKDKRVFFVLKYLNGFKKYKGYLDIFDNIKKSKRKIFCYDYILLPDEDQIYNSLENFDIRTNPPFKNNLIYIVTQKN